MTNTILAASAAVLALAIVLRFALPKARIKLGPAAIAAAIGLLLLVALAILGRAYYADDSEDIAGIPTGADAAALGTPGGRTIIGMGPGGPVYAPGPGDPPPATKKRERPEDAAAPKTSP